MRNSIQLLAFTGNACSARSVRTLRDHQDYNNIVSMMTTSLSSSAYYETFHFAFGMLLAFCQPFLLHRAWYRLQTGEFLLLFVVDQFLLLHFYFLPPKAKLPKQNEEEEKKKKKREVIQLDPTDADDEVKPIQKEWTKEDFQSLKSALQQMESVD